jgi:hypothetical protein
VNLPLGTSSYGPLPVDDDVRYLRLSYTANDWTDANAVLDATIEMSVDGGPFRPWKRFIARGRAHDPRVPNTFSGGSPFPGVNRQARVVANVAGARFRSTITLFMETTDGIF